jgi:hypothetical protein
MIVGYPLFDGADSPVNRLSNLLEVDSLGKSAPFMTIWKRSTAKKKDYWHGLLIQ